MTKFSSIDNRSDVTKHRNRAKGPAIYLSQALGLGESDDPLGLGNSRIKSSQIKLRDDETSHISTEPYPDVPILRDSKRNIRK